MAVRGKKLIIWLVVAIVVVGLFLGALQIYKSFGASGVKNIEFNEPYLEMNVNTTNYVPVIVGPDTASDKKFSVSSSDTSVAVASVYADRYVKIESKGTGSAIITVTSSATSSVKDTCEVSVVAYEIESVSILAKNDDLGTTDLANIFFDTDENGNALVQKLAYSVIPASASAEMVQIAYYDTELIQSVNIIGDDTKHILVYPKKAGFAFIQYKILSTDGNVISHGSFSFDIQEKVVANTKFLAASNEEVSYSNYVDSENILLLDKDTDDMYNNIVYILPEITYSNNVKRNVDYDYIIKRGVGLKVSSLTGAFDVVFKPQSIANGAKVIIYNAATEADPNVNEFGIEISYLRNSTESNPHGGSFIIKYIEDSDSCLKQGNAVFIEFIFENESSYLEVLHIPKITTMKVDGTDISTGGSSYNTVFTINDLEIGSYYYPEFKFYNGTTEIPSHIVWKYLFKITVNQEDVDSGWVIMTETSVPSIYIEESVLGKEIIYKFEFKYWNSAMNGIGVVGNPGITFILNISG